MLKYYTTDVVLQEVPNEISLALYCTSCPNRCEGCHSPWLRENIGSELNPENIIDLVNSKGKGCSCILFMGGDWFEEDLIQLLKVLREKFPNKKRALYSGFNEVSKELKENLNYLKVGPYVKELGGLDSPTTNQVFTNLDTGENLNHYFIKQDK